VAARPSTVVQKTNELVKKTINRILRKE